MERGDPPIEIPIVNNIRDLCDALDRDTPFRFHDDDGPTESRETSAVRIALADVLKLLFPDSEKVRYGIQPSIGVWLFALSRDVAVIRIEQGADSTSVTVERHSLSSWVPTAKYVRRNKGHTVGTLVFTAIPGFQRELSIASHPKMGRFWMALLEARDTAR